MKNQKKLIIVFITSIPFVVWRVWNYHKQFGLKELIIVIITYIIVCVPLWLYLKKKKKL